MFFQINGSPRVGVDSNMTLQAPRVPNGCSTSFTNKRPFTNVNSDHFYNISMYKYCSTDFTTIRDFTSEVGYVPSGYHHV